MCEAHNDTKARACHNRAILIVTVASVLFIALELFRRYA